MGKHAAAQVSPWDTFLAYLSLFLAWVSMAWDLRPGRHRDGWMGGPEGRAESGVDETFVTELQGFGVVWPTVDLDSTADTQVSVPVGVRDEVKA